jgi:two-component sensor histidine kinase
MKKLLCIFLLLSLGVFFESLNASTIDFTQNSTKILSQAELYITTKKLTFQEVSKSADFFQSTKKHINLGFSKDTTLWIKLKFYNKSNQKIEKILEVNNPLLESVILYDGVKVEKKGFLYNRDKKKSLNTIFDIELDAYDYRTLYLQVKNRTTALRLGLTLDDEDIFYSDEINHQALIFLFFGILLMLLIYTLVLSIYIRDKSYVLYAIYLSVLLAQQSTYLGVTQLFFPSWFIYYDDLSVVLKVNLLYIAAAFFAKSFLQTQKYPTLNKIYNIIIIIGLIEIPLFGFSTFYYPELAILTGFIFVIYNMYVGIYIYRDGYKQARLFVLGWSFLVIGYTLMIFDGLGIISFMQKAPNLIIYLTSIEAIFLSLAFTDRYIIIKNQKETADALLVETLKNRQEVIESEIKKQTKSLNAALENEQVILKELQHRTKNTLQLILSLTRMQGDSANKEAKGYLQNLENRINAIAKTHEMLYMKKELSYINMDEYIEELFNDLENLSKKEIFCNIEARQIYIPLREAGYIGLILNELITNSIKYVKLEHIIFDIQMHKENNKYILKIKDNGACYDYDSIKQQSMGLTLVNTLVSNQLDGDMLVKKKNGCEHIIRFELQVENENI